MTASTVLRPPVWLALLLASLAWAGAAQAAPPAPEFPEAGAERWLNSPPLRLADLRGKPVLVEFWTFGCQSCRRTMPWVQGLGRRLDGRMQIIGVHTPEFAHERPPAAVARKVRDFEIRHPVFLDNDFEYWNAMGNRYWPAFYLIDADGRVRGAWAGEVNEGSDRATQIEARIRDIVREGALSR